MTRGYYKEMLDKLPVITTIGGINIHFRESDQKFVAQTGTHKLVERSSLASVKKEVAKVTMNQPIEAMHIYTYSVSSSNPVPFKRVLVANENGKWRHESGSLDSSSHTYYFHWDPEAIAKLEDIKARREAAIASFDQEWREVCDSLRRVTVADLTPRLVEPEERANEPAP